MLLLRLKIDKILEKRTDITMYKLHMLTGIRPNTISDLVNNRAKQWSPDNLEKIYKALELSSVDDLIEYVEDEEHKG
jgi:DNA-binding Xre family transcriptional regulator